MFGKKKTDNVQKKPESFAYQFVAQKMGGLSTVEKRKIVKVFPSTGEHVYPSHGTIKTNLKKEVKICLDYKEGKKDKRPIRSAGFFCRFLLQVCDRSFYFT